MASIVLIKKVDGRGGVGRRRVKETVAQIAEQVNAARKNGDHFVQLTQANDGEKIALEVERIVEFAGVKDED